MFWANILRDEGMKMTPTLRLMIRSAIAIPAGSAAAERSFGMMNYVKDSYRATLSDKNLNHFIRLRHNGPIAGALHLEPYVDKYLESHERCDALIEAGTVKKRNVKQDQLVDNVHTIF